MNDDRLCFRFFFSNSVALLLSSFLVLGAVACSSDAGQQPALNGDPQPDEDDDTTDIEDDDTTDTEDDDTTDIEDDEDNEDDGDVVARVEVTPSEAELKERRTVQLSAKAFGEDDAELEDIEITWASSDENLATVDANGLVSTLRPGQVTITASAGDQSAEATITITESTVVTFEVPASVDVPLDGTLTLAVTIQDDEGYELLRELNFEIEDESIATVAEDGAISGLELGETKITVQLGALSDSTDVRVVHRFTQIFAGYEHTCGLTVRGRAFCWGRNDAGQIGSGEIGEIEWEPSPTRVDVPAGVSFQTLALGDKHSCGLTEDEKVWCWGSNDFGQLGKEPEDQESSATPIELDDRSFQALSSMADALCGLDQHGHAYCWGYNSGDMEFGNPEVTSPSPTPVAVAPPEGETDPIAFIELQHGSYHSCGLTADGRLFCWGWGMSGQIGNGQSLSVAPPVQVADAKKITLFALTGRSTCALREDENTYCWGHNGFYQVVPDPEASWNVPVLSFRPYEFVPVSFGFGEMHACALDADKRAYCWGANAHGQLGRATEDDNKGWIDEIEADLRFTSLVAGSLYTCGLAEDEKTYCWGSNAYGQLGNGGGGGSQFEPVIGQ